MSLFKRGFAVSFVLMLLWSTIYVAVSPPTTPYILSEKMRLGSVKRYWVDLEEIAPSMQYAVIAAEDVNFCQHWGFDMSAIRQALNDDLSRGASTISQQLVKNVFLWQERSWLRKALEAYITPISELVWTKKRAIELYLNVVEFDIGVFGVEAAARHYFDTRAKDLTLSQSALLAAVLPNPKERSAAKPSTFIKKRASTIVGGIKIIQSDHRTECLKD